MVALVRAASDGSEIDHCVSTVTSWVLPLLKCATAWRAAVSPISRLEGVTTILRRGGVASGPPQPVNTINRLKTSHRGPCHILSIGMLCFLTFGWLREPKERRHRHQ